MDSAIKTQAIFGLTLSLILLGVHSATITVTNNCPNTIWPATQTGGTNVPQLSNTGFELASKASVSINAPAPWNAGRIWARTQCSTTSGRFTCATADCGTGQVACNGATGVPPASLAEFTILGSAGQDTYDISLVDGFNLPLSIAPQGGSGAKCITTSCAANVLAVCPQQLQVKGSDGSVIACKSACAAFNQPQYCCTGAYNPRGSCPPTNYSQIFKNQCPQAYSYAQDDTSSTFACTGSPNYVITFCP